jgi:phospholipase C
VLQTNFSSHRSTQRFNVFILLLLLAVSLTSCGGGPGSSSSNADGESSTQTALQHVIVVVMQNSSFDHLFGAFTPPNGQTVDGLRVGVPGFVQQTTSGVTVSPFVLTDYSPSDLPHGRNDYLATVNGGAMDKFAQHNGKLSMGYYDQTAPGIGKLWAYAGQFALADQYFSSVLSNAPANPLFLTAASDNNFIFSVQPVYGPCNASDAAAQPYTFRNVGDELNEKGVPWAWYQENYGDCSAGYIPQQNPFQYFTSTQNSTHLEELSNFYTQLQSGTLPAVAFVQPGPRHSLHPGSGSIVSGLAWLDELITKVQMSPLWTSTAVVVIWDEGGGWYDHVPPPAVDAEGLGIRVPMLVISPLAKQGYISHVRMDHVSVLSFIQWNWKLGSLNSRNGLSGDMRDMFVF